MPAQSDTHTVVTVVTAAGLIIPPMADHKYAKDTQLRSMSYPLLPSPFSPFPPKNKPHLGQQVAAEDGEHGEDVVRVGEPRHDARHVRQREALVEARQRPHGFDGERAHVRRGVLEAVRHRRGERRVGAVLLLRGASPEGKHQEGPALGVRVCVRVLRLFSKTLSAFSTKIKGEGKIRTTTFFCAFLLFSPSNNDDAGWGGVG